MVLLSLFIALAGLLGSAVAGTYSQVTNFGENSSGARMYMYMPTTLAPNPPIIVAIHWCSGTAQAYYTSTPYAQYADTYGFIVIYPESPYSGTCWDVSSRATLTHDGGANSNSIANMVRYVLRTYSADASRVFVTGTSSGAMMTNVLAATYPDIFAAGIAYSGVPAGCFYTGTVNGWNSTCSQGNVVNTAQQWANVVFDMYPGYTGPRPRMQIYHGSVDNVLYPNNFNETVKQWSGVFGYSAPQQVLNGVPGAQYVKYIYGPQLEAIYGVGVGHSVNVMGAEDLRWFGIVGGSTTSTTRSATPTVSSSRVSTSTTSAALTTSRPMTTTTTSSRPATTTSASSGPAFVGANVAAIIGPDRGLARAPGLAPSLVIGTLNV
ncbi:hypothetical protein S40285_07606 [Stachybotrys chlorohalonatus IBT 40285]|uniref:Carboxylic ester hydrolase n=1 Tax=Stachybotrys chlorohalonatus (strain IBT 40285) TaxID=1283841 RepID=A0A084QZE9_STAC4|nr:hypothetical protein S40285_07606 [Stachybotrys chlorohalonata IBT 40285]